MSHLDKFLLSEDWCAQWPNYIQQALVYGLSDHCPVFLSINVDNWGPRPQRMLKCWTNLPSYNQFVQERKVKLFSG